MATRAKTEFEGLPIDTKLSGRRTIWTGASNEKGVHFRLVKSSGTFAASYLTVLMHRDDPDYRALLMERMERMDAGKKVAFDELLPAHAELEAKGL